MYYLGNVQTFTHNSFNGPSVGLNAAITAGVDFGVGASYAPDLSGRSLGILSTYSSVGIGISPYLFSGSYTIGGTKVHK